MKLPINPKITTVPNKIGEIHIILEYPDWSIKSLLRWIFTGTVKYTHFWEGYYKLEN